MNKSIALFGSIAALALSSSAANATKVVVPLGTMTASKFFFVSSDPSDLTSITANFGATTFGKSQAFDYAFTFTLPYSGTGSGSLSTSYAGTKSYIDIAKVLINGVTYFPTPLIATTGGQSLVVKGIPVDALVPYTIEVFGKTGPSTSAGTFAGTATFQAAVPEVATWAMMLVGFGAMGMAMRRRQHGAVSYA